MTHDAAVRIVVDLVPEIEKRGAAAALVDYARSEDLAPALLEKLAQVYNTLSTVSHIEHAKDRSSVANLVDVPELVAEYAITDRPSKSAAVPSKPLQDLSQVDLMSAMRKALDPVVEVETEKAAAAAEPRPTDDELRAAAFDMACDAMLDAEKAAAELRVLVDNGEAFDFTLAELDALCERRAEVVKVAFDWAAAGLRRPVLRADMEKAASTVRHMHADTTVGRVALRLVDAVATRDLMRKIAAGGPIAIDPEEMDKIEAGEVEVEREADNSGIAAVAAPAHNEPSPRDRKPASEVPQSAPIVKGKPPREEQDSDAGTRAPKPRTTTKDEKPEKGEKIDMGALGGMLAAPFSGVANAVQAAAGSADSVLHGLTTKDRQNKAQRRTDISVEDIRRSIAIRRMIGTDPVLRESDPREVLEMYNAIARTNPDIASNMQQMRLLLREALSYEGLTLDSQKQLADIRKATTEAELRTAENDRRRYAVGGVSLPQLTRLTSDYK